MTESTDLVPTDDLAPLDAEDTRRKILRAEMHQIVKRYVIDRQAQMQLMAHIDNGLEAAILASGATAEVQLKAWYEGVSAFLRKP